MMKKHLSIILFVIIQLIQYDHTAFAITLGEKIYPVEDKLNEFCKIKPKKCPSKKKEMIQSGDILLYYKCVKIHFEHPQCEKAFIHKRQLEKLDTKCWKIQSFCKLNPSTAFCKMPITCKLSDEMVFSQMGANDGDDGQS